MEKRIPIMAEKMTISVRRLLRLHAGLNNLDGVSSGDGKIERFDFDENVSWNISKNAVVVERALEVYERERKKLYAKHSIVEGASHAITEENAPKYAQLIDDMERLKDKTVELVGFLYLKLSDLNAGGKIPPSVKAALFDIIKE